MTHRLVDLGKRGTAVGQPHGDGSLDATLALVAAVPVVSKSPRGGSGCRHGDCLVWQLQPQLVGARAWCMLYI